MKDTDIVIEKMTEENYRTVAQLAEKNLAEGWSENTCYAQLSNPHDCTLIAYCGGTAVGFISVWCIIDEAEINNIAVSEQYRNRGIATALFKRAEELLPDAQRWILEVRESNEKAISLYRKLGFEKAGIRKNFYTNPTESGIIMDMKRDKL